MSGNHLNRTVNPIRADLPAPIASIVRHFHRHPEQGRLVDRVHAHARRMQIPAAGPEYVRITTQSTGPYLPNQLSFRSCTPGGAPIIQGTIWLFENENGIIINASGYLVSTLADQPETGVIVLETREKGTIPCLCPLAIIEGIECI